MLHVAPITFYSFLIILSEEYKLWGKKVKCTLAQALRLCTGRTVRSGSRGIALLFLDHGTRRGWGVSVTPRPLFTPGKDSVPILQEAEWVPVPVWTGAENLAPTGIRSSDHPTHSQSLYRLSYPVHNKLWPFSLRISTTLLPFSLSAHITPYSVNFAR